MNRNEQEMYKNIERIATALEKIVAQGNDNKLNKFKEASNLLYGNDAIVPDIQSDLDARIYKESQSITGGEFSNWHGKLSAEERESYTRVYSH